MKPREGWIGVGPEGSANVHLDVSFNGKEMSFIHAEWIKRPKPEWISEVARIVPAIDQPVFFYETTDSALWVVLESGVCLKRTGEAWHLISRGPISIAGAPPNFGVTTG